MASNEVLKISPESQKLLIEYINAAYSVRDEGWQLRNRLEEADRSYLREKDFTEENLKAKLANRAGDPTKLANVQMPLVLESVENSVGFLTNVFLTDYPIFKFVTDPDKQDLALQWNTLVGEDQIYFGWAGELNQAFRNGAKYNFAPIEVDWCRIRRYRPVNGPGGVVLEQTLWEGNRIRAIDPYNTIFDPRVPIHQVPYKRRVRRLHRSYVES